MLSCDLPFQFSEPTSFAWQNSVDQTQRKNFARVNEPKVQETVGQPALVARKQVRCRSAAYENGTNQIYGSANSGQRTRDAKRCSQTLCQVHPRGFEPLTFGSVGGLRAGQGSP